MPRTKKKVLSSDEGTLGRTAVLVLGMHRSGTSATSGVMGMLGAAVPKTLMEGDVHNARGYWESVAVMRLNEEILASAGSSWNDWRTLDPAWYDSSDARGFAARANSVLSDEFGSSPLIVVKDPRICRIAPFWLDLLREMEIAVRVVIPVRSPLEVAYSLSRIHHSPTSMGLLLWLRHMLEAEAASRSLPRAIFLWSDFVRDWRCVVEQIAVGTGVDWPRMSDTTAAEIDEFLDKELVRFSVDKSEFKIHPGVNSWILQSYNALKHLARNRDSERASETLDRIRASFDDASKLLGPLAAEWEQSTSRHVFLQQEVAERETRLAELEPALSALREQAALRSQQVTARDRRLAALEPTVAAAEAKAVRLSQEATARSEQIAALGPALGAAQAEAARLSQEMAARDEEVSRLGSTLGAAQVDAVRLAQEVAARDDEVARLGSALGVAQADVVRLSREMAARDEQVSRLGPALAIAQAEAAQLSRQVAARDKQVSTLEPALAAARAEAAQLSQDVAARDERIAALEPTLTAAQEEAVQLSQEVATLDARVAELVAANAILLDRLNASLGANAEYEQSWARRASRLFQKRSPQQIAAAEAPADLVPIAAANTQRPYGAVGSATPNVPKSALLVALGAASPDEQVQLLKTVFVETLVENALLRHKVRQS